MIAAARTLFIAISAFLVPAAAMAQPLARQIAVGGDVGLFIPREELASQLSAGIFLDAFLEVNPSARVGVRPIVSFTRTVGDLGYDRVRLLRLGIDGIYNWDIRRLHPFTGGGIGIQVHRQYVPRRGGFDLDYEYSRLAINLLGGVEVILNRAWTVKVEGRYQWVNGLGLYSNSGLHTSIGIKRYF